uniref:General transcription factor IIH subunit 4 n=1 Tax=Grammatophora oceanica TaxID=210454 RepID=A0A7S1V039_9STRA|mmetsp:Transcript_31751/g.47182  ORF Transcript_31751/g.47182 Transcript_31751/m.47182 type:complete len:514 (+) Transcript_31751:70-1611(+)
MPKAASGVLEYLRNSIPKETLAELYRDEARGRFVCRSVLQQLSDVGQQIVMRLACCGGTFPVKTMKDWVTQKEGLNALLKDLHKWGILQVAADQNGKQNLIQLTPDFSRGLQASISTLDALPWYAYPEEELVDIHTKARVRYTPTTPEDLERYTQRQWDAVLHFLVGTPNLELEPPKAVVHFLLQTGLMQTDPDYRGNNPDLAPLVITQDGYDFMLQDSPQQVWHFVTQYLQSLEGHKKSKELLQEAMLLLISLSFSTVGQAYAASSLSKRGKGLMTDLGLFGLLMEKTVGETTIFYPTRVALQLVQSSSDGNSQQGLVWAMSTKGLESALEHPRPHDSSHLAIVVQTNFQVCAYTTSELHISMLALFCDVGTIRRLPNVVFLMMTRDSIKAAFALGIQASQILRFLEKHAHPKLRRAAAASGTSSLSPIPANVEDQVWLWDREQTRVEFDSVYEYQCHMKGEFEAVSEKARSLGALAWASDTPSKGQVLVLFEYAQEINNFVRKWRAEQEGL